MWLENPVLCTGMNGQVFGLCVKIRGVAIKRTSHAVYDTRYHLVWEPKYRKWIKRLDIRKRAEELFKRIAQEFSLQIEKIEVAPDHVHVSLNFPPKYSISKMVGILKSISASEIFRENPEVKKELWGGEFWEGGYFVRTVGDQVTADVIKKYIEFHRYEEKNPSQLELF
jgi:putative transposase